MAEVKKMEELMNVMDEVAEVVPEDDKRMTEEELDKVAGGYTYGMIQKTVSKGKVTFKMHNISTGKVETYTGATAEAAMLKLVQFNYKNREKKIVLTDPKGKVRYTLDVEQTAKELGLKR